MIDIHSHILPNIDDGSRSIEETFNPNIVIPTIFNPLIGIIGSFFGIICNLHLPPVTIKDNNHSEQNFSC